jgi:sugar phosphate isomerase/epimerase
MGTNESFHYTDTAELRKNIENAKAFVRLSHDIGGTGIKVKPNAFPKTVSKEKTIEQIGKSLAEVGKFAADFGQLIRVEVHGTETQELPNMKAIMEACDHSSVKICWNSNPEDLIGAGLVANFNLVKSYFGDTVHVREMNLGDYPYQDLMNLLVEMNYNGWILLECRTQPTDRIAAIQEQRAFWLKMMKKARSVRSEK